MITFLAIIGGLWLGITGACVAGVLVLYLLEPSQPQAWLRDLDEKHER